MQRPTSVTVAAWVIIALAAEGIVGSFSSLLRPMIGELAGSQGGVPIIALLGSLVQVAIVVSALFMLRGARGARVAYAVLAGFVVLGALVSSSQVSAMRLIAAYTMAKTAILLYVLFRPESNAYFSRSEVAVNTDSILHVGPTEAFKVTDDSNRTSPN